MEDEMQTKFGETNLVVMDWSGVISDDRKPVFRCNQLIVESQGRKCTTSFDEFFGDGKTFDEFLRDQGIELNRRIDRHTLFRKNFEQACKEGIVPIIVPGIIPFLVSIRNSNTPMIVISAHLQEFVDREADGYHIKNFFKEINGSTSEGKASAIGKAYKRFGVKPNEVVFFGDMIFDVRSGKEAGVHTVAITTGYHTEAMLRAEDPDILAPSLVNAYYQLEIE